MSNKKRRNKAHSAEIIKLGLSDSKSIQPFSSDENIESDDAIQLSESRKGGARAVFAYLKSHLWVTALLVLFALGAMGAGLKYLEESAKRERAGRNGLSANQEQSFWSKLNPFASAPLPNPTPQLSKEYISAGSRTLAVEDANATATPPADLAVWRPSNGMWYVLGGPGSQQAFQTWGMSGDKPIPGDFDGDGKTDFSIFRPSSSSWAIYYSITNALGEQFPFGASGDVPTVADYDGDGKTDAAIFRPSNSTWYIRKSSTSTTISQQFGQADDIPTPADFDGDGKADVAIYRPSNSAYSVLKSSNSQIYSQAFGAPGDQHVPADYDGDGKADFAVRRDSTWFILQSSNSQVVSDTLTDSAGVGTANAMAVQNDYDGDGKVDVAVWRDEVSTPGAGNIGWWIIRKSSGGLRETLWGIEDDIPVPAYYRR